MEFLLSVSKEVRVTGKCSTVHDLFQNGQHLDIFKRRYATIYKKYKIHTHTLKTIYNTQNYKHNKVHVLHTLKTQNVNSNLTKNVK
jgi:hypothetical protein